MVFRQLSLLEVHPEISKTGLNGNRQTVGCGQFRWCTGKFYITGVQLEIGKNATEFEHRSYGEELALCQRYFYRQERTRAYKCRAGNATGDEQCLYSTALPVTIEATPIIILSIIQDKNIMELHFHGQFANVTKEHVSV